MGMVVKMHVTYNTSDDDDDGDSGADGMGDIDNDEMEVDENQ